MLTRRYKLPSHRMSKFWRSNDYSTVTIVTHSVLCTWKLLKSRPQMLVSLPWLPLQKKKKKSRGRQGVEDTSLVVQWLRIHLLRQGTRVWSLVQEHPTCLEATKPVHHDYWALVPQLLKFPRALGPLLCKETAASLATARQRPPVATKTAQPKIKE